MVQAAEAFQNKKKAIVIVPVFSWGKSSTLQGKDGGKKVKSKRDTTLFFNLNAFFSRIKWAL